MEWAVGMGNTLYLDIKNACSCFNFPYYSSSKYLYLTCFSFPRALAFVIHGLGEHILRYERIAKMLTDLGFKVCGHDHSE